MKNLWHCFLGRNLWYEMNLVSQMNSDPLNCFSLLTARSSRLSITSLLSTRPDKNSKPHWDFCSCDSVQTNCTHSRKKAGLTYSAVMGSSMINAARSSVSCRSESFKCYSINGTSSPIKHLGIISPPARFHATTLYSRKMHF